MTLKEFLHFVKKFNSSAGKITISALGVVSVIFGGILFLYSSGYINAQDTADTSVTVLNTAPTWTVDAEESAESSGTAPTNSGGNISWDGTATDSNGQNYYLIICKTNVVPTANDGGNPPTCDGGAGSTWAVSASTASGAEATATYTTSESDANQSNDWWAFVCDSPSADAACNSDQTQQGSGATISPFVINFRPSFTVFNDSGAGVDPGATETWTTTASDSAKNTDFAYDIRLYVCRTAGFTPGAGCDGVEWCNSGAFVASNPTCNAAMDDPMTDGNHDAFGYVIDDKTHAASGGAHGTNSTIEISNVAPSIATGDITLLNTTELAEDLELSVPEGETTGFKVEFTVTDQNSCETQGGGDEISSAIINVYTGGTGGVGQGNCRVEGDYNTNHCYPADQETQNPGDWTYSCSQDETVEACTGTSDNSVGWSCTFPLWFNAEATGPGTFLTDADWRVEVQATDDDSDPSSLVEGDTPRDLLAFTAFDVPETAITYGSLEAGDDTGATNQTTGLRAVGNTGLDEELDGSLMCIDFEPNPGQGGGTPDWGCTRADNTETIYATDQKYDTGAFTYSSGGTQLPDEQDGTPDTVLINVPKTTIHTAPEELDTFWGIQIPSTITLAGDYSGRNFILGVTSAPANW